MTNTLENNHYYTALIINDKAPKEDWDRHTFKYNKIWTNELQSSTGTLYLINSLADIKPSTQKESEKWIEINEGVANSLRNYYDKADRENRYTGD